MCPLPRLALACLFFAAPILRAAAAPKGGATDSSLIGAADLLKVQQLASPEISPDGRWVVYSVKSVVTKPATAGEYVYRTQLWLASVDGSTPPRELTHAEQAATAPQWSPDGRSIAFVRGETGKGQLWILPLADGGEAFQVTKLDNNVAAPRWSPDGKLIAFTSSVTASDVRGELEKVAATSLHPAWNPERPGRKPGDTIDWSRKSTDGKKPAAPALAKADGSLAERREWLARNEADANPRVTFRLNFLGESDLQPDVRFANLYVVDARAGATPRALAPDYESLGTAPGGTAEPTAPAWSADGKWIYLTGRLTDGQTEHPDRLRENDLIRVASDGKKRETLRVLPGFAKSSPVVSPDGRSVAFVTSELDQEGYAQSGLGLWTDNGSPARLLDTKLDRSVAQPKWSPDGTMLWFTAPSQGDFVLYRTAANGGPAERFGAPQTGVTAYDVSTGHVAYVRTSPENPGELIVSPRDRHNARTLSTHNSGWLRGKRLAKMEHRTLARPDGMTLDVWLIRPTNFDAAKKYPLLLEIHGGPSAMWGPGEASMWHEFQFFAARGYAIVFCNPRGSGGYGYAFQRANYQNWGPGPGSDVLAATDLALREPWVDASRLVITGGSYGGYLTAWVISQDPRFKAAVAQRGVYDLTTFFGEGNAWRLVPRHFGGYPWEPEIRKALDANSPFLNVEKIRTPLLIQHGDNDLRTGITQSQMLYKALKVLGRPVEYVRYPRATHELSRTGDPKQRVDTMVRYEEFFRRYIGEENAGSDAPTS
jgi:dipeptidyl aminopeptidase/acylaminoacyl peptidase